MCPKDYYKVLEVDYDATDEKMRLNYRRLALVSHISFLPSPWIDSAFKLPDCCNCTLRIEVAS